MVKQKRPTTRIQRTASLAARAMNISLDGYVEDEHGSFGWFAPNEEANSYINELASPCGKRFFPDGVQSDLELVGDRALFLEFGQLE